MIRFDGRCAAATSAILLLLHPLAECQSTAGERLDISTAVSSELSEPQSANLAVNCTYYGGGTVTEVEIVRLGFWVVRCNVGNGQVYARIPFTVENLIASGCAHFSSKVAGRPGAAFSCLLPVYINEVADYRCQVGFRSRSTMLSSPTRNVSLSTFVKVEFGARVLSPDALDMTCSYSWTRPPTAFEVRQNALAMLRCSVSTGATVLVNSSSPFGDRTIVTSGCGDAGAAWLRSGSASVTFTITDYVDTLQGLYECAAYVSRGLEDAEDYPLASSKTLVKLTKVPQGDIYPTLKDDPAVEFDCDYTGGRPVVSVDLLWSGEPLLRCTIGSSTVRSYALAKTLKLKGVVLTHCDSFGASWSETGGAWVTFALTKYSDSLRGNYSCRFRYRDTSGDGDVSLTTSETTLQMTAKPSVDLEIVKSASENAVDLVCSYSGPRRLTYVSLYRNNALVARCYPNHAEIDSFARRWANVSATGCVDFFSRWRLTGRATATFVLRFTGGAPQGKYQCRIEFVVDQDSLEAVRSAVVTLSADAAMAINFSIAVSPGSTGTAVSFRCGYSGSVRPISIDVVKGSATMLSCAVEYGRRVANGIALDALAGSSLSGCDRFLDTWSAAVAAKGSPSPAVTFTVPQFSDELRGDYRCRVQIADTSAIAPTALSSDWRSLLLTATPVVTVDIQPFFDGAESGVAWTCTYSGGLLVRTVGLVRDVASAALGCIVGSPTVARGESLRHLDKVTASGCTRFSDGWSQSGQSAVTFTVRDYDDSLRGAYSCVVSASDPLSQRTTNISSGDKMLLLTRRPQVTLNVAWSGDEASFECVYSGSRTVSHVDIFKFNDVVAVCDPSSDGELAGAGALSGWPGLSVDNCSAGSFIAAWRATGQGAVVFRVPNFSSDLNDGYRCRVFFTRQSGQPDYVTSAWQYATVTSGLSISSPFEPYEEEKLAFICSYDNANISLLEMSLVWNSYVALSCRARGAVIPEGGVITDWKGPNVAGCEDTAYGQSNVTWRTVTFTLPRAMVEHSGRYACRSRVLTNAGLLMMLSSDSTDVFVGGVDAASVQLPSSAPIGSPVSIRCSYKMNQAPAAVRLYQNGVMQISCNPGSAGAVFPAVEATEPFWNASSSDCTSDSTFYKLGRGYVTFDFSSATAELSGSYSCRVDATDGTAVNSQSRAMSVYKVTYCTMPNECSYGCRMVNGAINAGLTPQCFCPYNMALGDDERTCRGVLPLMIRAPGEVAAGADLQVACAYKGVTANLLSVALESASIDVARCNVEKASLTKFAVSEAVGRAVSSPNCGSQAGQQANSVAFIVEHVFPAFGDLYRCTATVATPDGKEQMLASPWQMIEIADATNYAADMLQFSTEPQTRNNIGIGIVCAVICAFAATAIFAYLKKFRNSGSVVLVETASETKNTDGSIPEEASRSSLHSPPFKMLQSSDSNEDK